MELDNVSWNASKFLRIVQEYFKTEIPKISRKTKKGQFVPFMVNQCKWYYRHKYEFTSVSSDQPRSTTHN